ncbi:MAG: hypothetical protein QME44_10295 [Thermodesulfobacteriota bacterium]|nr:hypothetical protein [Thermodesulfobacteriota bacterium]
MSITATKTDAHWNYFLSTEADLIELSRFVEFDKKNYKCFSVEMARLLMTAAAEVDVVCKQLCRAVNPTSRADGINQYREEIVRAFPMIPRFEVLAPRYGLRLKPWVNWRRPNNPPYWWTAYNKTKHHRHTEYHRACLKNVLNAVSGLFVVCLYLYRDKAEQGQLVPSPVILRPSQDRFRGITHGGLELAILYRLGDR